MLYDVYLLLLLLQALACRTSWLDRDDPYNPGDREI